MMSITTYYSFISKLLILTLFSVTTSLVAQDTLYQEDFNLPDGTTVGTGSPAAWTVDVSGGNLGAGDYFEVKNNKFEGRGVDGTVLWISQWINVQDFINVTISGYFEEQNTDDGSDFIKAFYKTSAGGSEIPWFNPANQEFGAASPSMNIGSGNSSIQIIIKVNNNSSTETHNFDNILVTGVSASCSTVAGTVMASPVNIEHNQSTNLTLSGHSGTIQWQQSTDGINFSDIVGATTTPYTTASLLGPGNVYFRAKVTDSCIVFSDTATVTINAFPGTICVLNTNNDGAGSLRNAINIANSNGVADVISFCIDGNAPHTITLNSQLPDITENDITIDGSTQTGSAAFKIVLDGNNAVNTGINILNAENVEIKGFSIINFTDNGIAINGSTSSGNIHQNHIAGNGNHGINISLTNPNYTITGNLIGTDETGTLAQSNGGDGIHANNTGGTITIGGTNTGERNIISANGGDGLELGATSGAFIVQGNTIGAGTNGTEELGNGQYGIRTGGTTDDILIGGTNSGEGNVIAFNVEEGVCVCSATNNEIQIRQNSMFCNSQTTGDDGIKLVAGANDDIQPPVIDILDETITGKGLPNGIVELFVAENCSYLSGKEYLASTTINGNGDWSFVIPDPNVQPWLDLLQNVKRITATQTVPSKGTSKHKKGPNNKAPCSSCDLICNGDFEDFGTCPATSQGNTYQELTQWNNIGHTSVSAEYFNSCINGGAHDVPINSYAGFPGQPAHSGNGYVGISQSGDNPSNPLQTSYIQQNIAPLIAGETYFFQLFIAWGQVSGVQHNRIGVLFSNTPPSQSTTSVGVGKGLIDHTLPGYTFIDLVPSGGGMINNNASNPPTWQRLCGTFVANGGEQSVTIGFFDQIGVAALNLNPSVPKQDARYLIDDVSLTHIEPLPVEDCGPIGPTCPILEAEYSWSPASGLSDPNIPNPIASPTSPTTYTLTVTIPECGGIFTDAVLVDPKGFADAGADQTICPGESTTLSASGGNSYSWTPTTGLSNPNIANPIASPTVTTTYQVIVTDAFGCQDFDEVTVSISTNQSPILVRACLGDGSGSLCLAPNFGTAPYTYLWTEINSSQIVSTNDCINFPSGSNYTYSLLITDAISSTQKECWLTCPQFRISQTPTGRNTSNNDALDNTNYNNVVLGNNEPEQATSSLVTIYPNPNNGEFNVAINHNENSLIEVFDVMGKKVFTQSSVNTSSVTINLANQTKGVYFVKVTISDVIFNEKVILQ
ncbi:MAG: T9SS type A sorting domain-containing protein [Vicingus serpentipes]|nr:T9SS type A sorting domain-containing protein [Vicingus serpentipes]